MAQDVTITRWTGSHLPPMLQPLIAEALEEGHAWMANLEPGWRENPFLGQGEGMFIAYNGEMPLGFGAMRQDRLAGDTTTGRLCFVYVRVSARRRGIAEKLIDLCLAHGESVWQALTLHTDNNVAEALYLKRGFVRIAEGQRTTHRRG